MRVLKYTILPDHLNKYLKDIEEETNDNLEHYEEIFYDRMKCD